MPFDEIATLPALASVGLGGALQALALMVHAGQVLPIVGAPNTDFTAAQRFNRMVATRAGQGRFYSFIAAPAARTGLPATSTELLLLSGVFAGHEQSPAALAEHAQVLLSRIGITLQREGKPVTEPAEAREMLAKEAESFLAGKLPLWRRLGGL